MRIVFRILGWFLFVLGVVLCLLGIASLPPGGLMFALPFVFFVPGVVLLAIGAVLLFFTRSKATSDLEKISR